MTAEKSFLRGKAGFVLLVAILIGGGYFVWQQFRPLDMPPGFAKSNGRLEAERTDIATKFPGRVKQVLVKEGDSVKAGQILAIMDGAELEAQLQEAEAAARESEQKLDQSIALFAQRKSELTLATQEYERSRALGEKGYTPIEKVQQRLAVKTTAEAAIASAKAGIARAKSAIIAAAAHANRLKENLKDYILRAPHNGRVQYRLVQPGEVLGAGGRVLTLLDLTDVYMTIFLPINDVAALEIGAEVRILPDTKTRYVVPATVSFVAPDAQFTPKYVETKSERAKLMFRVKLRLPQEILKRYAKRVKVGVTGVAYVRITPDAQWPDYLAVNLPKVERPEDD